jgi:type I restriction enzyme S subunit
MMKKYKLNELGSVSRGKSKHRPRNDPKLYGGEYPFIQTGDVKHSSFYVTFHSQTYNEKGLEQIKKILLSKLISGKLSVENLDIQFPPSMLGSP